MHAGSGACKVAALVQLRDDRQRDASWWDETPLPASGRFVSSTAGAPWVMANTIRYDEEAMWKLGSLPVDTSWL